MDKLLPRIQLICIVLFAVIAIFGPMLVARGSLVIITGALAGVALGVVTFLIGWRLAVAKETVRYPFSGWSYGILKLFLNPKQARSLKPANRELSPLAREAIGISSLVVGPLLVIALIIAIVQLMV